MQDSLQGLGSSGLSGPGRWRTEAGQRFLTPFSDPFREFKETLVFELLDLAPCIIKLSTAFGLSKSIN
jgi:hypothetical protein